MRKNNTAPICLLAGLLTCVANAAEPKGYNLTPEPRPVQRVRVQLEVRGKLLIPQHRPEKQADVDRSTETSPKAGDNANSNAASNAASNTDEGNAKSLPLSVDGALEYDERTLPADSKEIRAVRHYRQTSGKVIVNQRQFLPKLHDDRRLVLVTCRSGNVKLRGLQGALTREELELVDVQANSLLLDQLLPPQSVQIQQSWPLDAELLTALFRLDATQSAEGAATLERVAGQQAIIALDGIIDGTAADVPTRIQFEGAATFDLQRRGLSQVDVTFKERRRISGAQPGIDARSRLRVELAAVDRPAELSDDALAGLLEHSSGDLIRFVPRQGVFTIHHDPRWRVISDSPRLAVLRLLDRGDVVAQGNLSLLPSLPAGKQLSLDAYRRDVEKTLKSYKGQVAQVEQRKTDNNLTLLRVSAVGTIQELSVEWVYLHLSNDKGQRVSCVFTLESKMADRFHGAELELVSGLQFGEPEKTPAQARSSQSPPAR